jgi:hypothetical protein
MNGWINPQDNRSPGDLPPRSGRHRPMPSTAASKNSPGFFRTFFPKSFQRWFYKAAAPRKAGAALWRNHA